MAPRNRKQQGKGNQLKPEFGGFFGRTGSGKSHALWGKYLEWQGAWKRQTLVWSPKERHDHYAKRLRCKAYTDIAELVRAARQGKDVVFVPTLRREVDEPIFDLFNRLALALSPCIMIAEELHTVTKASGGTHAWHINTTMGRGDGLCILGSSQRPAHVDKNFFGALSFAWCGQQNFEDDAKTTAKLVLRHPDEIMRLPEFEGFTRSM